MKNQILFQNHLMEQLSFILIGLPRFTEKAMEYLHQAEFYLITKVQEEEKPLLQEK